MLKCINYLIARILVLNARFRTHHARMLQSAKATLTTILDLG